MKINFGKVIRTYGFPILIGIGALISEVRNQELEKKLDDLNQKLEEKA